MDFNELPIDNKLKNSIKFADFKPLLQFKVNQSQLV